MPLQQHCGWISRCSLTFSGQQYYFIGTLSQTLTLRAAFASSTYLLSQIPGPGRSSDDDLLIPLIPFSRGRIRPSCAPERMATASLFFGRHLMMPCCSFWTMAGQRYCQRRIAKHLSRAGFCRCRRSRVSCQKLAGSDSLVAMKSPQSLMCPT